MGTDINTHQVQSLLQYADFERAVWEPKAQELTLFNSSGEPWSHRELKPGDIKTLWVQIESDLVKETEYREWKRE